MAKHSLWHDEYWLLLMQLYLRRPQGVKPLYSRALVGLALELHIAPDYLYRQMFRLRQIDTPRLQKLWDKYAHSPRKLARGTALLRQMIGFGNSEEFYAGVEVNESWEKDFKPVATTDADAEPITPVQLIMILDLYFRLTPVTMAAETPEVAELARLLRLTPEKVAEVMAVFRFCDPLLSREDIIIHPLLTPCMQVWKRFGNERPEKLAALAAQLQAYFKA